MVFRTSATSFHGVPAGVACPEGDSRKSIALYYFRDEGQTCPLRPTHYVPLPGDSALRRALIRADRWLLAGYSFVKRHTPLSDATASKILNTSEPGRRVAARAARLDARAGRSSGAALRSRRDSR